MEWRDDRNDHGQEIGPSIFLRCFPMQILQTSLACEK